jgi:polyhydroxyalkanoate synthesis repressor PhaR
MSDQRVIKRYANRKLYDTQHSKYVTLEQIADMIRRGDDVQIVDNKTKEDLTSVTLAQIIFEEEKKQKSFLPLQAMRNIIQNGGGSISSFMSKAQERVTDFLPRKGKEGEEEDELDETPTLESEAELDEDAKGRWHLGELREWLTNSQRAIDDWQRKVDDRIRNVARGISPFASVHKDVELLSTRIAELESKLKRLGAGDPDSEPELDQS